MPQLVIISGLPGSGKSTKASKEYPHHYHLEADAFMMINGEYKFDPKRLNYAHKKCQNECFNALDCGRDVVVSNTNLAEWEFVPYLEIAESLNIENVHIIRLHTQYGNIHGVTPEKLEMMRKRMIPLKDMDFINYDYITFEEIVEC